MASQNLFEKYGIKEVADVTFYRIEKKEETYESQREISASSVLKGALELREVYPLNDKGVGDEEGFKAYVFTDASLIEGTNYDCDDSVALTVKMNVTYKETGASQEMDDAQLTTSVQELIGKNFVDIFESYFGDADDVSGFTVELGSAKDAIDGVPFSAEKIEELLDSDAEVTADVKDIDIKLIKNNSRPSREKLYYRGRF